MKKIALMTFAFAAAWASISLARTTYVNGNATQTGYCTYSEGSYCISNVKTAADREAGRQAEWNCQMQQGRPLSYTSFCSSSCYPNVVPPTGQAMVRCTSDCRMQCEVAN